MKGSSRRRRKGRRSDVFHAISDPTRRCLLEILRTGERTVSGLAAPFHVSRPAISQHLRILRVSGLVGVRRAGRKRFYRLQATALREVHDWVALYEEFWTEKLKALGSFLKRAE